MTCESAKLNLARTVQGIRATQQAAKFAGAANERWFLEGVVCTQCQICHKICYSTDSLCRECLSDQLDWILDSQPATLRSFTRLHVSSNDLFQAGAPWSVGLVEHCSGLSYFVFMAGSVTAIGVELRLFTAPDVTGQSVVIAAEVGADAKALAQGFAAELSKLGTEESTK